MGKNLSFRKDDLPFISKIKFNYKKEEFEICEKAKPNLENVKKYLTKYNKNELENLTSKIQNCLILKFYKHGFSLICLLCLSFIPCFLNYPYLIIFDIFLILTFFLFKQNFQYWIFLKFLKKVKSAENDFIEKNEEIYLEIVMRNQAERGKHKGIRLEIEIYGKEKNRKILTGSLNQITQESFPGSMEVKIETESGQDSTFRNLTTQSTFQNYEIKTVKKKKQNQSGDILCRNQQTPEFKLPNKSKKFSSSKKKKSELPLGINLKKILQNIEINVDEEKRRFVEIGKKMENLGNSEQAYISSINKSSEEENSKKIDKSEIHFSDSDNPRNLETMLNRILTSKISSVFEKSFQSFQQNKMRKKISGNKAKTEFSDEDVIVTPDRRIIHELKKRWDGYPCQSGQSFSNFKSGKNRKNVMIEVEGSFNFDVKFSKIE